ncbi:MAG TPA: LytTR family DNA-binding domain-containing protein [Bacteroidia bacterium]|jgi:DNA-binding LytR/AlgR family response regulator|nr:LytTR family DNA-binding domain-containing protein [Bacteroidia bacterium]
MITAIAIDDEPPALKIIENFCAQQDAVTLLKTFTKPSEALKYLRKYPVDLLFLDIQMPSLSGLNFYKEIEQVSMVIFTTAYSEYAVEGFNLNAVDYLLKPFTFERFMLGVNKAREFHLYTHQKENATQEYLFIRVDYSLVKVKIADILYIEGLDDYLQIYLEDQKKIVPRMTMKAIMSKLPAEEFIRVHRSFIVPLKRIEQVRNKIIFASGKEIPLGSSYEENFFKIFQK